MTLLLVLYLLATLAVGLAGARRARAAEGFYVAERSASAWLVAASLVSTILGASTTLGMAGRGYRDGWPAAWWMLVGAVGLLVLAFVFADRFQSLGVVTLPAVLERQYGPVARRVASGVIVVGWLGVVAAQFMAAGKIAAAATGTPPEPWLVASAAVVALYTAVGGQVSVLRTDLWMTALLLAGLAITVPFALAFAGGWPHAASVLPPDLLRFPVNEAMPARQVLTWLVIVGLPYVAGPDMASRLFCARDPRGARLAAGLAAAALVPIAFTVTGLGLLARAGLPGLTDPDQALPALVMHALPPVAAGALVLALLSAVLSSASLLTAATALAVDLAGSEPNHPATVRRTRWMVAVYAAAALAVAWRMGSILDSLLFAYSLYTCGIAVPVLLGFWRERLGLTAWGAVAALLTGGGVALAGKLLGQPWSLWAVAASTVALLAVSRLKRSA